MNKEKIIKGLKWFYHSYIWIGILVLIVDIISKNIIANNMNEGESFALIPGFLSITYTINRHAAFGIGPENPVASKILYISIAAVAIVAISIFFAKSEKKLPGYVKAALASIAFGALGNMIDRIVYSPEYLHALSGQPGGVVDFIDFFNGSKLHDLWHYIFNIADCGVVIGVFILIIYYCFIEGAEERKKEKEAKKAEPVDNTKVLSASEKKKLEEQEKNRVQ